MLVIQRKKLVQFLYLLIRDTVPPGEVERIMKQVESTNFDVIRPIVYSNEFLAGYAESLVKRMSVEAP